MEWTRGHTIGHGATAAVSVATDRRSGDVFAVKSAELSRSAPLQHEHEILSRLDSPYIIGHKGCDITTDSSTPLFNLKLEYAPGGAVRRHSGCLDERTIRHYTRRIVKGLEYMHSRGIVHCDVKGSNILICQEGVKIADFGCAKVAGVAAPIGGTPMYMSPEVARGEEQGFPADVWALGCTVIEMFTGKSPWPETAGTVHRIAFSGELPEFPVSLSDIGKDFLSKCLKIDPKERWTAGDLLRHPFLDEFEIPTGSPTSVLDQGIWGKIGERFLQDSVQGEYYQDSLESPKQRMQELWVNSGKENWEWGEGWVSVRSSGNLNIIRGKTVNTEGCVHGRTEGLVWDTFQFL